MGVATPALSGSTNGRVPKITPTIVVADTVYQIAEKSPTKKTAEEGNHWTKLFQGNKLASKGLELRYIPPDIEEGVKVIKLDASDIADKTEKWKEAAVIYMMGKEPTITALERFIASQWNFAAKPTIYYYSEGYYVVLFHSIENGNEVLHSGPYMMNS
ncbi:hypothetical protein P3L10_010926 [Capsicum annuum]